MRTPTIITTAAISLLCTLATLAREPQPVLKDYKSGITIYDQIGNLGLTHASYFTFKMRNFTYAKESHLNNTDSITFTLETNKFFQLQNLEEETWESIQQHAKEIYRLSSPMNSQKGDYTYAYTDTKTLKKSWAQHGEILLLTGWQQYPTKGNYYPQGKIYNLHLLTIIGDQSIYITVTRKEAISIDDPIVAKIIAMLENKEIKLAGEVK